ncbi:tigger transposable element-derived protein 6-like [Coccinella septempunctata]|uniref:tigger transposable element-derived protein 6-like n=1 Tax=Coccinella septempunctata TaxID=41139 RepID=UPI001D089B1F|nr:tigger transposable element-derived protein 6-like [Coccinella septempunctata]
MPTEYRRKLSNRGKYTEDNLKLAIEAVRNGSSVNGASKMYGIPRKTLERKIKNNISTTGRLGPDSMLGEANEIKLVQHIKKAQKYGFPMTSQDVRKLAYNFAEGLLINHKFSKEKEIAGSDWLRSFMRRHPDLSTRKAEGLSLGRGVGMNRVDVRSYFELLHEVLKQNDLFDKPGCLFNVDETGLQLNNRPGHVLAEKGARNVVTVTSGEKGETISCIACCNAEGFFLPPVCIFKGKNSKKEWTDSMPPGSHIVMSQKSAYVTANIFLNWFKNHFLPRKGEGKALLILDGHSSHCSCVELLETAEANDVILLCLPPHSTHYLQPLDRAFFKSLKTFYYQACKEWMQNHPGRKLGRPQFGELLTKSWGKSASAGNAMSGFRATGIFPWNPDAIPDYAYTVSDQMVDCENREGQVQTQATEESRLPINLMEDAIPSCSHDNIEPRSSTPAEGISIPDLTPGKLLTRINPTPALVASARKRAKTVATALTSPEHIASVKDRSTKKKVKELKEIRQKKFRKKNILQKRQRALSTSSDEENIEVPYEEESDALSEVDETECVGCGESYNKTRKQEDWLKCIICQKWFHENCSSFLNTCQNCGKTAFRKK